jgi:hypothetical protein
MAKLNQIIAIEKGTKSETQRVITESYHLLQKEALLNGLSRSYKPRDEDGDQLPDENQRVQVKVLDETKKFSAALTKLFDITHTKDVANCKAKANVEVDGKILLTDVPVTTLLFLEKQLVDLHTYIKKLPVLNPAEEWKFDATSNVYRTEPFKTTKTKKVLRNHVKAKATDKHPEQVDVFTEDLVIGDYSSTKFSGALPSKTVTEMLCRVESLQRAVKFAREEANSIVVDEQRCGQKIFDFVFSSN